MGEFEKAYCAASTKEMKIPFQHPSLDTRVKDLSSQAPEVHLLLSFCSFHNDSKKILNNFFLFEHEHLAVRSALSKFCARTTKSKSEMQIFIGRYMYSFMIKVATCWGESYESVLSYRLGRMEFVIISTKKLHRQCFLTSEVLETFAQN